jgi:hypothetical protein
MRVKVSESCTDTCGVRVAGELDTATREFIYRFTLPAGAEAVLRPRETEVEGIRLLTFAPNASRWVVDCPVCGSWIAVGAPEA